MTLSPRYRIAVNLLTNPRQHPQWWYLQFWHHHHQGFWILHSRHDADAGVLSSVSFSDDSGCSNISQIPYGLLIAISILVCVYLNDRFKNRRCLFILLFLCPNIAGAFGLRFVPQDQQVGRLMCYYLTGPYNAAFVLVLSMQIANTAGSLSCPEDREWSGPNKALLGHTKKVVTNAVLFLGYCTGNIVGPFFYLSEQA